MLRVALIALAHGVTSTTVDLSQDWVVNTDAKAEAALDAVVEEAEPTTLPCFGSGSGDTPSSPCPEPRSQNLRGRR